ncbi:Tat pathway signal protein, partial [Achromobacter xylosoxidans]
MKADRREFLLRACALGATHAAAPLALNLAALGAAAAQSAANGDYKALVCVFLYGGNDPFNTLVPFDAPAYRAYAAARSDIALPRDALQSTALRDKASTADGAQFALAPSLAPLARLFARGEMAAVLNVGPLVVPTSKADYIGARVPLPPKLFSHNDQQSYWQALAPEGASSGWAGRRP